MNYKICKKLEKVGFPQTSSREKYCTECKKWATSGCIDHNGEILKNPTLEELMDACLDSKKSEGGFKFFTLETNSDIWIASVDNEDHHKATVKKGKTRKMALANLYLKLNDASKKDK